MLIGKTTHEKNALAKFIALCKIILLKLAYVYMIRHVDNLFYESYNRERTYRKC